VNNQCINIRVDFFWFGVNALTNNIFFLFLLYILHLKFTHVVIVQLVSAFWRLEKVWRARLNKNDELYIITRSTHNIIIIRPTYIINIISILFATMQFLRHIKLLLYFFCFVWSFGSNHYIVIVHFLNISNDPGVGTRFLLANVKLSQALDGCPCVWTVTVTCFCLFYFRILRQKSYPRGIWTRRIQIWYQI